MAFRINSAVCNGCDACVTACPTQAIHGIRHEVHEIDPELCVSCGLCIRTTEERLIKSVQKFCNKKRKPERAPRILGMAHSAR